jgi:ABC-type transport system substrate-binding protein
MRRLLIPLLLALLTAAAGCGGGDEDPGEPAAAAPATTVAATTTAPPATLAPETTAAPARAKALQQRLKRTYTKVTSVKETADAVTIETSYIFNDDNALAAVEICEAAKAALADSSFVEIMAVDDRWLARTTVFTGRCKASTLIR